MLDSRLALLAGIWATSQAFRISGAASWAAILRPMPQTSDRSAWPRPSCGPGRQRQAGNTWNGYRTEKAWRVRVHPSTFQHVHRQKLLPPYFLSLQAARIRRSASPGMSLNATGALPGAKVRVIVTAPFQAGSP